MISDFMDDYEPTPEPKLPPSRRIKCTTPFTGQLPERIANLLNVPMCVYQTPECSKIANIDGYIRSMGFTGEEEAMCRKLYTPEPEPIVETVKKFIPTIPDILHVYVNMNILKSGTIRVKLAVPMEPVYEYQRKGKMAPLDVRIKAAKAVGYPEEILLKMIKNHDDAKAKQVKLNEFIDVIFGKSINAKVSKPKAKTIHESINAKLKKKPAKKW